MALTGSDSYRDMAKKTTTVKDDTPVVNPIEGPVDVLDLFAGSGWGVAAKKLGLREAGVEIMKAAQQTRELNGMHTLFHNVWDGLTPGWEDRIGNARGYTTLLASPPCFVAGTPVLTKRGSIPIEEVEVGDWVYTHRLRWRQVTDTMNRVSETVKIGPVVSTPDHPFYVREQIRWYKPGAKNPSWGIADEPVNDADRWVNASETKGLFLATPASVTWDGDPSWEEVPAWLAGRYVADGWTGRDGIMIAVGDGTEEPEGGWAISQSGPHCRRFTRPDHELASIFTRDFGKGAANKTIPAWALAAPEEWRKEFLEGYIAGDGTPAQAGHRCSSVSANLISQLRLLSAGLHMSSYVSTVKTPDTTVIEGRTVNQRDYWAILTAPDSERYTRYKDGFQWARQRKDPKPMGEQVVYDITVDEDHSFTAWGYTVHNCQSFSQGGKGKGRQYLDVVLDLISKDAHLDVEELQNSVGILGDEKTALVLTPLAYALRDRPKFVAFEQVPSVKPVWEASAEKMREAGYSVWTGIISSEIYGVPQARRRAYLIATLDGEATLPPPTHSLYYSRNPTRLDEGVKKWVTMAEGLGRSKKATAALPDWAHTRPSTTIVGSFRPDIIAAPGWRKPGDGPRQNTPNSIQVDLREAGLLQSYPDGFEFGGSKANQWLQVGNAVPPGVAEAVLRHFYKR